MPEINLCNSAGRDARVALVNVHSPKRIRWVDEQSRQAGSIRLLKAPIDRELDGLVAKFGGLPQVGTAILDGDPEVDLENAGRMLKETSRVYVNPKGEVIHQVTFWEVLRNPDGSQRERRLQKNAEANLAAEIPLKWSGIFIKKADACRKFVFSSKVQLQHVNGLTYDFLFNMAKELEAKESLLLLGAGPKSKEPLILRRGGAPYRGFLEGRTQGDQYCLTLHFSNLELKAPPKEVAT
jgi:hypothetical protein